MTDTGTRPIEDGEQSEDWEVEEGIPQMQDAVMQKYFQGRDALIDQEDSQRSDQAFRQLLSPLAREACALTSQIRFEEHQTTWTNPDGAEPQSSEIFPGMMFALAREKAEGTKLFDVIRKMPKGALLHCHLEAMIDPDWLCNEALKIDGIHVAAPRPLSSVAARAATPFTFQFTQKLSNTAASIWSDEYQANTWVPMRSAADSFPDGGSEGFIRWFKTRSSLTLDESLSHHLGTKDIWKRFLACFGILRTLIYYEPLYRRFLRRFFEELLQDGVRYVEIRAAFSFEYRRDGHEEPEEGFEEMIRVLGEEIDAFKSSELGQGFWGARMIWTSIRSMDKKDIVENMYQCIETKMAYPELIAGYDLVGHEDPGPPLAELTPIIFHFRKLCAEAKVNIPFFFHAGETATSGSEADQNLFDAILLGSRRLGHGFSLYKHPMLMKMTKDRHVCIECCPISNEILRLTSTVTGHPLPALLAHSVPVALSNDDPGVLGHGSAGMTHDFWQALQSIESLGLEGLGYLAENSVRYAAFEDQDPKTWNEDIKMGAYGTGIRAQRMKEWKSEWEKFAQWVVMEHGVDLDLEQQD